MNCHLFAYLGYVLKDFLWSFNFLVKFSKMCKCNFNDLLWKMRTAFACYSDRLENQQAMSNCLYFRCTVMHQKECESAKMAFLHDIISQSELTTMKNEKTTKNKLFCFWWQI